MDNEKLSNFLVEAKQATYAVGGGSVPPFISGSKQLEYRHEECLYRDIYYGGNFFAGQEVVWEGDSPQWSMTYAGGVSPLDMPAGEAEEIYKFLQTALAQMPADTPYRGPRFLSAGRFAYYNDCDGALEHFWGAESITRDSLPVYRLHYSGGRIR